MRHGEVQKPILSLIAIPMWNARSADKDDTI